VEKRLFKTQNMFTEGKQMQLFTFPNGLKLCYQHTPHNPIAHCGFIIHAGSRDDHHTPGIAHCMEHMVFKGTHKRKSFHILNRIDGVGGEINAYTTKEITAIYASVYKDFFNRAVELLFDITFHSAFPEKPLQNELKIIQEEINIYNDSPDDSIFDEFQEHVFANHPLGSNILGTNQSLPLINQSVLFSFAHTFYKPDNMVFFVSADLPLPTIQRLVDKYQQLANGYPVVKDPVFPVLRTPPAFYKSKIMTKETEHQQAYFMMGGPASEYHNPQKIAESLLMNILGGPALNSRLNLSVREKSGLAYHVESGSAHFTDTGFYHCFAGTDPKNVHALISKIKKEIQQLKNQKLGTIQLSQSINQFLGQVMLGQENHLSSVMVMAKQWLLYDRMTPLHHFAQQISSIKAETLWDVAHRLFDESLVSEITYLPTPD
jgi:predicted Zn-dependent peptidase